jgi:1,4-alpha-glucan branching enzyme
MQTQLLLSSIGKLIDGTCDNPGDLLGPHRIDYRGESAIAIRSFLPQASAAWVVDRTEGERRPMRRLHPAGFFEAIIPASHVRPESANFLLSDPSGQPRRDSAAYSIEMADSTGKTTVMQDPYAAPSILSDFDRYLIGEGRHHQLYARLGAHPRTIDGQSASTSPFGPPTPDQFKLWVTSTDGTDALTPLACMSTSAFGNCSFLRPRSAISTSTASSANTANGWTSAIRLVSLPSFRH